jgi:hypothetical protein
MARASVHVTLAEQGANLRVIARELRRMDDRQINDLFKRRLTDAARPFVPRVQAAALAIPVKAEGRHTGLRARIAACAEVASWEPRAPARGVSVAVQIQPKRMPNREKGLPLYMEGVPEGRHDRWRHPVFGRSKDPWEQQPPHPYFYRAAAGYGRASGAAMQRALDDITHKING